jgi:hypothetical protein
VSLTGLIEMGESLVCGVSIIGIFFCVHW